mmetsp:Transcript_33665/g.92966  ORF Transcript_33665/g.92966 Transcript_33665/m.92966 type:complete len:597 (+) Transcript_33665:77-1867(+)
MATTLRWGLGARALLLHLLSCGLSQSTEVLENRSTSQASQECYTEQEWRKQGLLNYSGAFRRCGPLLVCIQGHASCEDYCDVDEECEHYPLWLCDEQEKKCRHKNLFEHTVGPDIGAALLFFVISGLALSAGIGGGGLYVPLLMLILGFSVKQATATSQACLAGGASTALVYNLRQRHPSGRKPMIDYDLVLVMGPNLLIGALIGSALNAATPSWLILVLLTAILCQSTWKTFQKAIETWRKESAAEARGVSVNSRLSKNPIERLLRSCKPRSYAHFDENSDAAKAQKTDFDVVAPPQCVGATAVEPAVEPGETNLEVNSNVGAEAARVAAPDATAVAHAVSEVDSSAAVAKGIDGSCTGDVVLAARQQVQYPKRRLAIFGLMWLVVVLTIFIRGGRATPGLVPFCSVGYWILALLAMLILACISVFAAGRAVAHASPPGDFGGLEWTVQSARRIAIWSLIAGTMAALCGIGGGMVMGPILLGLGFMAQVQSATTATTLFVMSTSTCLALLVAGTASLDYSLWLAFSTGCGAVFGKAIVGWIIKKFQRPSLIMFLLGGIICTSVIVMLITGIIDIVNDIRTGEDLLFKGLCDMAED